MHWHLDAMGAEFEPLEHAMVRTRGEVSSSDVQRFKTRWTGPEEQPHGKAQKGTRDVANALKSLGTLPAWGRYRAYHNAGDVMLPMQPVCSPITTPRVEPVTVLPQDTTSAAEQWLLGVAVGENMKALARFLYKTPHGILCPFLLCHPFCGRPTWLACPATPEGC